MFRSHANPYQCYEDKRVQDMEAKIRFLVNEMQRHAGARLKDLIKEVIRYFKTYPDEKHNPIPSPLDQYEVTYP